MGLFLCVKLPGERLTGEYRELGSVSIDTSTSPSIRVSVHGLHYGVTLRERYVMCAMIMT